jgi:ATP-binding cassette, subfamily B, bacterial PglK
MKTPYSIIQKLKHLWVFIGQKRRIQFLALLVLMIFSSFLEVVSIGAVLPFLAALTAPDTVFEHSLAQSFIKIFEITSPKELLLPLTIIFALVSLLAGSVRLLLLWFSTRLSFNTGADLSFSIYQRTLYQPYIKHIERNSSEIINGVSLKTGSVITTLMMTLNVISSSIMLVAVLFALISFNPSIALATFGGFGLIYGLIMWITKSRQLANSQHNAIETTRVIKYIQEGLGGIRDILLDGSQPKYCQIYQKSNLSLHHAQSSSVFISAFPRYGVETLSMVFIAFLAYFLAQQPDGISNSIPVLGALALGAQRTLPVLQQAYFSWSSIQANQISLQDALDLLDQPLPSYANQPAPAPLSFRQHVNLKQISFRYNASNPWVVNDVSLTIDKGSQIGFIGTTGSGKSTLIDIIMGLLLPNNGYMDVDGQIITSDNRRAWQAQIAHVPQSIFLLDDTIEQNIAFGIHKDKIDHGRVRQAALQAKIANNIDTWPDKYQTLVGERGVRLSGGQRQRIGIARALYKKAQVIIFDEATSALDVETEQAIMKTIEGLNKDLTILIIAHRISTLKNCTRVVEIGNGSIVRIESYEDIIKSHPDAMLKKLK